MTYEQLVKSAKKSLAKVDVSKADNVAIQVDITGEGEGAFYVKVNDGMLLYKKSCNFLEIEFIFFANDNKNKLNFLSLSTIKFTNKEKRISTFFKARTLIFLRNNFKMK